MARLRLKKSTTVRISRWFFGATECLAPAVGARVATRTWFTLPHPPRDTGLPDGGTAFEVQSQRTAVRGRVWGTGPVVYLVHGWGGRGSQLGAFVEPLVRRGHRVVLFDAPSHGDSDPGLSGPRSTHGVEMSKALDAVAARFGPAAAVVAHSMGAVVGLLTMRYGWLSAERLVLLAPMGSYATQFAAFSKYLGIGPRIRRRVDEAVARRVGIAVDEFDVGMLAGELPALPTLVVHDRGDRQTFHGESVELVGRLPDARLLTTDRLGHHRLLADAGVVEAVTDFVASRPDDPAIHSADRSVGHPAEVTASA